MWIPLFLSFLPLPPLPAPQPTPPNVILIFSDDQGSLDLGCYGSTDLKTPHLDALAARGVRFTQFYAAAPICSPSRAALLTGRYPHLAGVPGNVSPGAVGLPDAQVTIAEVLRPAGYATALIGKWHLGRGAGQGPRGQGFDVFFGHHRGCIDNYSHFFYWSGPNVHDLWRNETEHWEEGRYFGDLVVREARAFLDQHRDRPFFLFLPLNIPHYPLQGKARFRELYRELPEPRRSYAALVSTMDDLVGQVFTHLESLGLRERTLIIFMSDHGHSTEVRTLRGGGNAGPYRGSKFSLFEGGIRVPAIASWPGRLPEGEVRDVPATAMDWLPTIAELAGVPLEASVDGKSLVPVLESDTAPAPHEVLHWQTGRNGRQWAIRKGGWKLVAHARDTNGKPVAEGERLFLSDLDEDVTERTNRATDHPEIVEELTRLHREWSQR